MSTTAKVLIGILFLGIAIAVGTYFYKRNRKKPILIPPPDSPPAPVPGVNPASNGAL